MSMIYIRWNPVKVARRLTPEDVATAVWDAQVADHQTAGSFGSFVKKILKFVKLGA